jgi:xylulose-5-phosphate/fructose-6-phosphate phosphoketolase
MVANTYLEGSYSEIYSEVPLNEEGLKVLFRQFSFPAGIPSHVSANVPGSINEEASLAIPYRMHMERLSIIQISSLPV